MISTDNGRKWRALWLAAVCFPALVSLCGPKQLVEGPWQVDSTQLKADLLTKLKHVDRLVVTPPVEGDEGIDPDSVLFEVSGREKIMDLVSAMEFKGEIAPGCLCFGLYRFQFFRGNDYKFDLGYSHFIALRGELAGPWFGDAVLTDKGRDAVIAWFAREGFGDIKTQWDAIVRRKALDRKYVDEVAAFFPSESRTWFPARSSSTSLEASGRSKQLAALYPRKADLILSCWRAFGLRPDDEARIEVWQRGEPSMFIWRALSEADVSPADFAVAVRESDQSLWLGAFVHLFNSTGGRVNLLRDVDASWPVSVAAHVYEKRPEVSKTDVATFLRALRTREAEELLSKITAEVGPLEEPNLSLPNSFGDEIARAELTLQPPAESGRALIERCSEMLETENDAGRRAVIRGWRGRAHLQSGEYAAAYADLKNAGPKAVHEYLLAALALGRLGEVFRLHADARSGRSAAEKEIASRTFVTFPLYLAGELEKNEEPQKASGDFETDVVTFLARKKNGTADAKVFAAYGNGSAFQAALVLRLTGKSAEKKLLQTAKSGHEKLLAHWVLAELAIQNGNAALAEKYLAACLAFNAYADPVHIMARLRRQDMQSPVRDRIRSSANPG